MTTIYDNDRGISENVGLPRDKNLNVYADATGAVSFSIAGDGTFKPVIPPRECNKVMLVVRDLLDTYTHISDQREFHISTFADGTDWIPVSGIGISIIKENPTDPLCYVRSEVGTKVIGFGTY